MSNTLPVLPTSSSTSLPNVVAFHSNVRPLDLEHQMRMFMVEKRGHGSRQQHSPASVPTASPIAPPPRKYVKSTRSKPRFIAPPPGGRGLPPAIATSATYYAASGSVVTRTQLRPVHRGSPTLSHKSPSSTSSSPVEAPPSAVAHNRSRSNNNHPDSAWGAKSVPQGPKDIFWPSASPSSLLQPSPDARSLTHIESPLLPPPPSTVLLGRSGSLTRRNNSDLRIVPPQLTTTGVAGKTGLVPPPVSPPMPKQRTSPGRAKKTPVSKTSDVLDTVYSIYNKLPTSRDRSNSDSADRGYKDRDFVSRLATKIVPRRSTPSPSPPSISPQPITQPQSHLPPLPPSPSPPPPPPKSRPGDVSPPIIPLVELLGSIPSTPPRTRSPSRKRSPRPHSPRSPPPSAESAEVYSRLPLPAVPDPAPQPLFSTPTLPPARLFQPPSPTQPATGDVDDAVELVEWFENFCHPESTPARTPASTTTIVTASSPQAPASSSSTASTTDATVLIPSEEGSFVTGRTQFLSPHQQKLRNSGMYFPKRKPVPMSMYSTASSIGNAFRFDEELGPISTSKEEEGDKLCDEIKDILDSVPTERRRTRYIAGRNSALDRDVIFCLKACEL